MSYYETDAAVRAQNAVDESHYAAQQSASSNLTWWNQSNVLLKAIAGDLSDFGYVVQSRQVEPFKECASARLPASMHGFLTPVSFDSQRAVFYAQNPRFPAYGLTVDQLILYGMAQELERRKKFQTKKG